MSRLNKEMPDETLVIIMKMLQNVSNNINNTVFDTPEMLNSVGRFLIKEFWYLKIGDFQYVFNKIISGAFGKIYGKLDTPQLCEFIRTYENNERNGFLESKAVQLKDEFDNNIPDEIIEVCKKFISKDIEKKENNDKEFNKFYQDWLRTKHKSKKTKK